MAELLFRDGPTDDPLSLITAARVAACADVAAPVNEYLQAALSFGVGVNNNQLSITGGVVLRVGDLVYRTQAMNIGTPQLDIGSVFIVGRDYYVYLCDSAVPGGSGSPTYRISLNATFPAGFTANNSRKIGGFHFGRCRRVNNLLEPINSLGTPYGTGWETNTYDGIVPKSVWTLKHRPKRPGDPEGMVYAGGGDWVDIYLVGPGGVSSHGVVPLSGTEGHNYLSFSDLALKVGKKLMSYSLWLRAAYGSPQGNAGDNILAWTATTTTGRAITGATNAAGNAPGAEAKLHAVSSIGCVDCVGNLWEWLDEVMANPHSHVLHGTTNPTTHTYATWDGSRGGLVNTTGTNHGPITNGNNGVSAQGAWNWDRDTPLGDTVGGNPLNGNIHQLYDRSLTALLAGAGWAAGTPAGCRALLASLTGLWHVPAHYGSRFACDSL